MGGQNRRHISSFNINKHLTPRRKGKHAPSSSSYKDKPAECVDTYSTRYVALYLCKKNQKYRISTATKCCLCLFLCALFCSLFVSHVEKKKIPHCKQLNWGSTRSEEKPIVQKTYSLSPQTETLQGSMSNIFTPEVLIWEYSSAFSFKLCGSVSQ